ncbi:signal recognition particle, SRP9/SRP14 subunit [Dunaliella salina]|uniref:Signal recognition particle, SRP9/SRP14 subunit n=1 Tax=Dunaliella salina TaxID=3046 RepID=A0ABQ7FZD7_DUNSA|nr:signal recognition particle, SRP9/SRP14 subunit [Dunaliella salina]|eukprot:KAF5827718.1 signal recognition particle, SRP9/SRP14 subunit [Dunaliella salina]
MYIEDFESFYQQAEALYRSRPLETRYCIKYRNCDGILALKVTDDVKCLQYKTDQQSDLRKLERINNLFMALAAGNEELAAESHQQGQQQQQQHQQQKQSQHKQQQQQPQSEAKGKGKGRKKG